jgi:hypothetical protein
VHQNIKNFFRHIYSEEMTEIYMIIICTMKSLFSYLADNIFICYSNNQTIFWCIVFIFVLMNKGMTSVKISFTLWNWRENQMSIYSYDKLTSTTFGFYLISFKVWFIFNNFNETLRNKRANIFNEEKKTSDVHHFKYG